MKAHLTALFIILLACTAGAQTTPEYLKTNALQFSFNGLNLGTINAGIGAKTWTSETTAFLASLGGWYGFDKTDPSATYSGSESRQARKALGNPGAFSFRDELCLQIRTLSRTLCA